MSNVFAVTMGDSSGVGPEIILHAFQRGEVRQPVVVFGDLEVLAYYNDLLGYGVSLRAIQDLAEYRPDSVSGTAVSTIAPEQSLRQFLPLATRLSPLATSSGREAGGAPALHVLDAGIMRRGEITTGRINAHSGEAAREYVVSATKAALAGQVRAIITLPMNKEATRLSTPGFSGHTELIGEMCGVSDVTIMLVSESLIVTHVSTHVSMREAIARVRKERIATIIRLTCQAVARLRENPRIAVAGLNPHAGENGLFGDEEITEIRPAVEWARSAGLPVEGPLPPDTVFYLAVRKKRYDAVVCMYHDQGHVPLKLLDFEGGVNVTLGLPITRTSVDHGTAFDIAGNGTAATVSLVRAVDLAARLASK